MIVLKHLCREFDIDPYKLRRFLRKHYPRYQGRWQWQDNDPKLTEIRQKLKLYVEQHGASS